MIIFQGVRAVEEVCKFTRGLAAFETTQQFCPSIWGFKKKINVHLRHNQLNFER